MISRISIPLALLAVLLVSSLPFASTAAPADYDLIIRNGRVIDGTGRPGFNANVAIKGDQHLMSLELAIHKMTGLPAGNLSLKSRGLIREGYFADITIFDPKTVIDRATFEDPNQYPLGINFVVVNGEIEVDGGQRTPALAGRVLRGPGYVSRR
jgi:N-acyl-D-aspartate/D-glutamate deacylase